MMTVNIAMNKKTQPVAVMCFSSGTGGMERSAVRLAEILSEISDVTLICKHGSFLEKLYSDGNYSFRCESVKFLSRTFSFSMLFGVRAIINQYDIKNAIFFGASELKTLYFSFLGKNLNVTVWHGTTKSRTKRDVIHNLIYSCVNHHVAISEHLGRNVKEIVPITKHASYRVIRPSFSFGAVQLPVNKETERNYVNIVHVGRVASGKGQIDAVLACRELHDNGVSFKLKIVGGSDGHEYLEDLKRVIGDSPYKESIFLEGFVEDVSKYLREANVFLFPSLGEGMPGSVIEALYFPLICLTYKNTVFPEFQEMGFHFHMVENGNKEMLGQKLLEICSDLDNERELAAKNPDIARKVFSTDREINEWLGVLV